MSLTDATYIRGPPNQIVPDGGRGKAFLSAPRQGARVAFGDEHAAGWQGDEHRRTKRLLMFQGEYTTLSVSRHTLRSMKGEISRSEDPLKTNRPES